ncbi:hypothetical protein [Streptomyces sp. NPDC048612]|uniref:hypothetical protein n=1 Tax=Streptomyces sp. NPDC048612 TaxID=3365579 RepID=UPI00371FCA7C
MAWTIGVGEIAPIGLPVQGDVVVVCDLQQLLQVARLPHEAVRVVREDVRTRP